MSREWQFKPEIALKYGVNEAIFLHSLQFWILKNWSNGRNLYDGRYWSYDTYKAIAKRFPFWTARQIERIVSSCEKQGAILVGNYNEDKTDRTKWYALAGYAEEVYMSEMVDCILPNGEMAVPQDVEGNTPDGEMQNTKSGQPIHQTVKCNKVTVSRPSISPKAPQRGAVPKHMPEVFARFLAAYPKHTNRIKAVKAWDKLKPDMPLCQKMADALEVQKRSEQWTKDGGEYIPHPATWLNGSRWEDEVAPVPAARPTPSRPRIEERDGEFIIYGN